MLSNLSFLVLALTALFLLLTLVASIYTLTKRHNKGRYSKKISFPSQVAKNNLKPKPFIARNYVSDTLGTAMARQKQSWPLSHCWKGSKQRELALKKIRNLPCDANLGSLIQSYLIHNNI